MVVMLQRLLPYLWRRHYSCHGYETRNNQQPDNLLSGIGIGYFTIPIVDPV